MPALKIKTIYNKTTKKYFEYMIDDDDDLYVVIY